MRLDIYQTKPNQTSLLTSDDKTRIPICVMPAIALIDKLMIRANYFLIFDF